jgi:uronate dehydrogenase
MPVRPDSYYGVSKATGEAVGRLYAEKFGLRVACLRIGSFAERPSERRHLSTWVSFPDTVRAFRAAMTAPDLDFAVFYVASANRDLFWDMDAGARLGYHPEDHAESFGDDLGGAVYEFQGGDSAGADFTLARQHGAADGSVFVADS